MEISANIMRAILQRALKKVAANNEDKRDDSRKLDKGKEINDVKMESSKYTYDDTGSTSLLHDAKDRAFQKQERLQPLYEAALRKANGDKEKAEEMANKAFDETYREREVEVPSTAIDHISYDPDTELLSVNFVGGKGSKTYRYAAVPLELVQALLKAPSKGSFFNKNIADQYSLYGPDHSPKSRKQGRAAAKYFANYIKNNKGHWSERRGK